jgi:hypothetical protein
VRKGITCVTYANYAIATGTKGATPTIAGENLSPMLRDADRDEQDPVR